MFNRMQTAINALVLQLERYKIDSEIILVDYNPPSDRPFLKDSLQWPDKTDYCTIRTIVVPPELHRQFKDSDKIPFYGSLAQNVGIRRARGQFVLATPIDILFANELIELISKKHLDTNKLYRTDRLDVSRQAIDISSLNERLDFCRDNITFIHLNRGGIPVVRKGKKHISSRNIKLSGKFPNENDMWKLHFNGGDFTLMSKDAWTCIRGWPQDDILSLGVEIVLYCSAYLNGVMEEILQPPYSIYHIEHNSRWHIKSIHPLVKMMYYCLPDRLAINMVSIIGPVYGKIMSFIRKQKSKLNTLKINYSSWEDRKTVVRQMLTGQRPPFYNNDNWGFGEDSLEEYSIVTAGKACRQEEVLQPVQLNASASFNKGFLNSPNNKII
jgi:hypothetical protein